jgi:hypothetical protein
MDKLSKHRFSRYRLDKRVARLHAVKAEKVLAEILKSGFTVDDVRLRRATADVSGRNKGFSVFH